MRVFEGQEDGFGDVWFYRLGLGIGQDFLSSKELLDVIRQRNGMGKFLGRVVW